MKITELIPGKKVVWLVLDNYFNFTQDETEWKGTKIVFELLRKGDKTEIHFSHLGLVPEYECFNVCSNAWGSYINGSLRSLITTGKGNPNTKETGAEVEVDPTITLTGPRGPVTLLDAFEGRRQLIAYYFMRHTGHPAPEQCEGCMWVTTQVRELSYLHSRDVTFAVFCQGPYEESARYRAFMGWDMPWYSAQGRSLDVLLTDRRVGRMHIICYLRQGSKVFETYRTTSRGVEVMDNSYHLLDLTVYGRQEKWEDSPAGWPQQCTCTRTSSGSPTWRPEWPGGRPIAQWPRIEAGHFDDLGTGMR